MNIFGHRFTARICWARLPCLSRKTFGNPAFTVIGVRYQRRARIRAPQPPRYLKQFRNKRDSRNRICAGLPSTVMARACGPSDFLLVIPPRLRGAKAFRHFRALRRTFNTTSQQDISRCRRAAAHGTGFSVNWNAWNCEAFPLGKRELHMRRSTRATVAFAFVFFSFITAGFSQGVLYAPDQQPSAWNINQKPTPWDINLAAGAVMVPTFHGSNRYRVSPVPLVIIRWRDTVSLGVEGLSVYWHHNNLRIGGGVNYDGGRLDHETNGFLNSGDDRLKGLGNVDSSVGIRGFVSYKAGPVYFDTSVTKYLGSENNGLLANLSVSAPFALTKRFILRPHLGGRWTDNNYMQTFFGVTALQASRSIFPQFSTHAGIEEINGGLTVVYLLNKHWFWGADATATRYLGSASKSPITISDTNATVATVIGYHF